MLAPEGAFYTAEDAGAVGKEGEYYVWTTQEIEDILSAEEARVLKDLYGITDTGNFENNFNVLSLQSQFYLGR